jgi:7-cyano-7-deazaguanine synthase
MSPKTALLLSGGMDSTSLVYWKRPDLALTIDYGQMPAQGEILAAATVCGEIGIPHQVLRIDCGIIGSGDLAGSSPLDFAPASEWWPYRNQLLVTFAAALLVREHFAVVLIGTIKNDGFHADGTADFVTALSTLLEMQEGRLRVDAPAIDMTAASLVRASGIPLELLAWSHSCHTADLACGRCRGCEKHRATMTELGVGSY